MISKTPTGNGQALDVGVTDIADALYVRACHGQAPPCGQVTRHPPHTTTPPHTTPELPTNAYKYNAYNWCRPRASVSEPSCRRASRPWQTSTTANVTPGPSLTM